MDYDVLIGIDLLESLGAFKIEVKNAASISNHQLLLTYLPRCIYHIELADSEMVCSRCTSAPWLELRYRSEVPLRYGAWSRLRPWPRLWSRGISQLRKQDCHCIIYKISLFSIKVS